VGFEDGWLIKSSFITKDEIKLVSCPGPKANQKIPPEKIDRNEK